MTGYVTRLDAKYTPRMQLLTDNREDSASALTVQNEGFANCGQNLLALKGWFDGVPVE
ncbi:hypothetical protein PTE30175_02245 [Pandoraea terrae]|uniref:Uncharacterized protein n=1 Tax=Pandoraea terrae TaxID=1537710 RepID=A0A5E4UXM5_9BURK|nr:hypothetical protein PTE30175_02245 [Pandoraea terrae]